LKDVLDKQHVEIHHVQPRSWGGNDETSNLVKLTQREHLVAHKPEKKQNRPFKH